MEKFQSRKRKHHYFVISNPLNTFRPYLSVHVSSFSSNIIAPWVYTKTSILSMRGILVLTSAYARTSVRTDSWGGGRGVPRQPNGGGRKYDLFLVGNRAVLSSNQRRFSWQGESHVIFAFETEVSLKA